MPAGTYTVTKGEDDGQVLMIKSADQSQSVFVEYETTRSDAPASKNEITFNRYGQADFLSRISLRGQKLGIQLLTSKAEQHQAEAASAVAEKHSLDATNRQ